MSTQSHQESRADIDLGDAIALNNFGVALERERQHEKAVYFFEKAVIADPDLAIARINLAHAYFRSGEIGKADMHFSCARKLQPESATLLKDMGRLFRVKRDFAAASDAYLQIIGMPHGGTDGLESAMILAILYYLQGDRTRAAQMIARAAPIRNLREQQYLAARRYVEYISRLLAFNQEPESGSLPTAHVIGDSHAISVHGVCVTIDGSQYHCESDWIEGCNQWNVGGEHASLHRKAFDICLRAAPKDAPIILLLGQIDCLAEGGIFQQWIRNPGSDIEHIVDQVVHNYISRMLQYRAEGWRKILIGGVPAPGADYPVPEGEHGEKYLTMVGSFNNKLMRATREMGLPFLDLYGMTTTPAGTSNALWNIDYIHLRPDAFVDAFKRHLTN